MDGMQALLKALDGLRVERDVPMHTLTTLHIGGKADIVLRPENEGQVQAAAAACARVGVPMRIMGNGSNILAPDEGVRGLVVIIGGGMDEIAFSGYSVTAGAGLSLTALARATIEAGLQGLEWAAGIPGTVGGACAMNAGAYGGEIKQSLVSVRVLEGLEIKEYEVRPADMGYRQSAFAAPGRIVMSAVFRLEPDDGGAKARMADCTAKRQQKQPLRDWSAGSTFKRPPGHYAGALIEGAGLKGACVGGAAVSEKHAGFLVNKGGATAGDMLGLIGLVRARVYAAYGVALECELKIW